MEIITFSVDIGTEDKPHIIDLMENVYSVDEWEKWLIPDAVPTIYDKRNKDFIYKYPAVFDIETTSVKQKNEDGTIKDSYGFMYHWQFCFNHRVVFGRTWKEFERLIFILREKLDLGKKRLVIYAHNLSFEWQFANQFLYRMDSETKPFFTKKRQLLCARMKNAGLEWRCSWKLSNMSARKYIENAESLYRKQSGKNYNYGKMRTPKTPLTMEEKAYCYCDVRGIEDALYKELEHGYDINNIPLTSTGFVRRDTLRAYQYYDNFRMGKYASAEWVRLFKRLPPCREHGKYQQFHEKLKSSQPSAELYQLEKDVARGGDTHSNMTKNGKKISRVRSFDRVSSYPAVQMTKKYPSGKWIFMSPRTEDDLRAMFGNRDRATMARLYLSDVKLKKGVYSPYIMLHKCQASNKARVDNGRIYYAKGVKIAVTEIDFEIICEQYTFNIDMWEDVWTCENDYLPVPLRAVNLHYFLKKTELKNGDQYLYMKSKNKLNGIFGMTFTDIIHDLITYDPYNLEWLIEHADAETAIEKYYNKKGSHLRYDIGLYCTAWARWELWQAVKAVGDAYIYSDTDSVKWATDNPAEEARILAWFEKRNQELTEEAESMGAYVDYEGVRYHMGIWEDEGKGNPLYASFKTFGAKKYAYHLYKDDTFHITVAGMAKDAAEYIENIDNFVLGLTVDGEHSGRTISVWQDAPIHKITIDGETFTTASSVAVFNTTYKLDLSSEYSDLVYEGKFILK